MTKHKKNCWEYMKCGRQPGGDKVSELGVCPAAISDDHEGINEGRKAGRFCWVVAGTLCTGECQGTMAHKILSCLRCPFYLYVEKQEGDCFALTEQDRNKHDWRKNKK